MLTWPLAQKIGICEDAWVKKGYCNETNIGEFILAEGATDKSKNLIETYAVHLKKPGSPTKYMITQTGYYCVLTDPFTSKNYKAVVEFRNAYGELAATQIPKLPFYGGITILYALVAVFWGFLYYQHRQDIRKCPVEGEPMGTKLTLRSARTKLHHGHPHIPRR